MAPVLELKNTSGYKSRASLVHPDIRLKIAGGANEGADRMVGPFSFSCREIHN
jgi:hypothetical protein